MEQGLARSIAGRKRVSLYSNTYRGKKIREESVALVTTVKRESFTEVETCNEPVVGYEGMNCRAAD
jgi:hypothetical protein